MTILNELAKALAKAQGEFPAIPKDKTVTKKGFSKASGKEFEYGYNYADLTTIIDCLRPVLSKNGLCFTQSIVENDKGALNLKTTLFHDSGQSLESLYPVIYSNGDAQILGGAVTYAKRYALSALLGVSPDDDLDANESSSEEFKPSSKPVAKPQAQAAPKPTPPVAPKPINPAPKPTNQADNVKISQQQAESLKSLGMTAGWSMEDMSHEIYVRYSILKWSDLTQAQLEEMKKLLYKDAK
jgi:hypothetical protein